MARQPKLSVTTIQTCPRCSEQSLRRERRPGHWSWRCEEQGCGFHVRGDKHGPAQS